MEQHEVMGALDSKNTLVHYNMPILVSRHPIKLEPSSHNLEDDMPMAGAQNSDFIAPSVNKTASTEEMLDTIFPPRQWEENGIFWRQTISSDPVTLENLTKLGERLDQRLFEQGAKEDGIDVVRLKLYGQFFDEIIRMETVICGERGLLLGRIRDDLNYTMVTHRKLYESCMGYALRKTLNAEKTDKDEAQHLKHLKEINLSLRGEIAKVREMTKQLQLELNEQREEEKKKHAESLMFLKETNEQLKAQLRALIKPRKANPYVVGGQRRQ